MKKFFFYVIMIALVIVVPVGAVTGYFLFRKLTFSYDYCEPYGQIDSQIGWRLKPDANSCLKLQNHLTGKVYFDTKIYTNTLGFRSAAPQTTMEQTRPIAVIGDSWTFGYGVDYEESFPHFLEKELGVATLNLGVPAYGSGSTLQLFSRHFDTLKPSVVVHFTLGLWTRSICRADEVEKTLLPCFWVDQQDVAQFSLPRASFVEDAAKEHHYPGGYLTSGYKFREMFFILKPREIAQSVRTYMAAISKRMGLTKPIENANSSLSAEDTKKILELELRLYKNILVNTDTTFVLYDPRGYYMHSLSEIKQALGRRFIYLSAQEWEADVASKFKDLPADEVTVPGDGHYAVGANRLIAKSITNALNDFRKQSTK
jgi:hypothetical protein